MSAAAVLCSALAAWWWCGSPPHRRWRHRLASDQADRLDSSPPRGGWLTHGRLAAACIVVLGFALGGGFGFLIGLAAAPVAARWINGLGSRHDHERALEIGRSLPVAIDLMAAALDAGAAPAHAVRVVAQSSTGPVADVLHTVAHRWSLSNDVDTVWDGVDPNLEPVARAFRRADSSGISVVALLTAAAQECRRRRAAERRKAAASVAVRTAAPLGVCFLPAFFLVGIVPAIVGAATDFLPALG